MMNYATTASSGDGQTREDVHNNSGTSAFALVNDSVTFASVYNESMTRSDEATSSGFDFTGSGFTTNKTELFLNDTNATMAASEIMKAGMGGNWDDATWILSMSFIIFTMQTGFGLLEAGAVQTKNEVNIMIKNAADVVYGGLTYWAFGYAFSFGDGPGANAFCGLGQWFVNTDDLTKMGPLYANFIFQLSFTTTATTIVSGAMAERAKLDGYILFSFLNTLVYCFPAHWIWADIGFLRQIGCVDIAGSGAVHLLGGSSAVVAAWMLGPRIGRFDKGSEPPPLGNPTNTMIGTFMLWWGWLAFNAGSTYGISGGKWILAAKSATCTMLASMGGGFVGIFISYVSRGRKYDVCDIVNSVLGALVGITAGCAITSTWEAVLVGMVGGCLSCLFPRVVNWTGIDDPVGAIAVHFVGGIWGMLAVGLFAVDDRIENYTGGRNGLFHGGGWYLLGVQALTCVCIIAWSTGLTFLMLLPLSRTVGIRLEPWEERLGVDYVEHGILRDPETIRLVQLGYPDVEVDDDVTSLPPTGMIRGAFGYRRPSLSHTPTPSSDKDEKCGACVCHRRKGGAGSTETIITGTEAGTPRSRSSARSLEAMEGGFANPVMNGEANAI